MDSLSELISLLNNKDIKEFINYLKQNNKRNDVKNIQLLESLKTDDINNFKRIYHNKQNNDAYHALRKRLHDSLLFFLSNKTFEDNSNEANEALKLLVVGRFLYENNLEKVAYKCLLKAEVKAKKLEQFSLLNEIYATRLHYIHLNKKENFNELALKLQSNLEQINHEVKLNLAYAYLRRELEKINNQGKIIDLKVLIQSTMTHYKVSLNEIMTYKSLVQILYIANEYASIHQDFRLIESYIKSSYEFLENQKQNSEHHLYYHIQILYYLANFSFRNLKFEQSFIYLNEMENLMEKQHKLYYSVFYPQHQLILALNYHFTNQSIKAIEIIENVLIHSIKKASLSIVNDLQATYIMFLGQKEQVSALKSLSKLMHTDNWYEKKIGILWTIRKNLMEILIHAQFENIDFALNRIKSFKRRYRVYLENVNEERVLDYINLVEKYLNKPEILETDLFQEKLNQLFATHDQDVFILSYIGWLLSLKSTKSPYEITLNLIKNKSEFPRIYR